MRQGGLLPRSAWAVLGRSTSAWARSRASRCPFIDVNTDFPSISCLGAQKAGWTVKVGNYFAMGSGPARALPQAEAHLRGHRVRGRLRLRRHLPRERPPPERGCHEQDRRGEPTSMWQMSVQSLHRLHRWLARSRLPDAVSRPRSTNLTSSGSIPGRSLPRWERHRSRRSRRTRRTRWARQTTRPSTTAGSP